MMEESGKDRWQAISDAMTAESEAKTARLVAILESHGIYMDLEGCGCCGSPRVRVDYQGETIIDEDHVTFEMIPAAPLDPAG